MIAKKFKVPIGEFPKTHAILWRDDFSSGRSASNKTHNRLGVNFKSKAFKTAAERNRLRRTVFDFFRTQSDFLSSPTDSGVDLLITLNPAILTLTKDALESKLKDYGNIIQRNIASPAR